MNATMVPRQAVARAAALPTQPKRADLSLIKTIGAGLPNRYLLYAVRGWGKTSLAANATKPIFITTEDGLDTLIDANRIPETPHFPQAETWEVLQSYVDALIDNDHDYKTLVIDVIDGCESLCHRFITDRDYNGDFGKRGFSNYMQGYGASIPEWKTFLSKLDTLRTRKGMTIFGLCHTRIAEFKNPTDLNYDRYVPNIHEKTWCVTADWADVVLFGNYDVVVTGEAGASKGKGKGGQIRMLYTEHHAAYDAKNRLGLPPEIEMGNSAEEGWAALLAAIKAGRKSGREAK